MTGKSVSLDEKVSQRHTSRLFLGHTKRHLKNVTTTIQINSFLYHVLSSVGKK